MANDVPNVIRQRISQSQNVLVVSHVRPDGDAIGALLGLGLSLQNAGKSVQMVLNDGLPASFRYLPGSYQVTRKPTGDFDLSIVVDCSDLERTGGILGNRAVDINIDHHATNLNFGQINFVEPEATSTCEVLAKAFPDFGLSFTPGVASALLTGLVSDTIGFRTANVTPHTLRLAADLMEQGANLSELYGEALIRRSYEAARYWGQGLGGGRLQRNERIVWTSLTLADREMAHYPGNDDADLINLLSSINGSDVAILFIEQKNNLVKVSWRAVPGVDVSKIALQFGGGGHMAASGAMINGNMEVVQEKVLAATAISLNGNGTINAGQVSGIKNE